MKILKENTGILPKKINPFTLINRKKINPQRFKNLNIVSIICI